MHQGTLIVPGSRERRSSTIDSPFRSYFIPRRQRQSLCSSPATYSLCQPANIWSWTSLNYFLRLENRPPKFSLDTCSTGVDSSATISESRFSNAESSPSLDSTFLPSSCTAAPCSSMPLENCLRAAVLLRRREFRTKKGSTSCFGTRLK
jgi:hypothetical protein